MNGLRARVLAPILLIAVATSGALLLTVAALTTSQLADLVRQESASLRDSVLERLQTQRSLNERTARILAASDRVISAVASRDSNRLARILPPRLIDADIENVAIYTPDGEDALYSRGVVSMPRELKGLVGRTMEGETVSIFDAQAGSLMLASMAPIQTPGGTIGAIAVAANVSSSDLKGVGDESGRLELALFHEGSFVSTTVGSPEAIRFLTGPGVADATADALDDSLSRLGFHGMATPLDDEGNTLMLILTSTAEQEQASSERFAVMVFFAVLMLLALVMIGLSISRDVVGQVEATVEVAEEMARGSFGRRVRSDKTRELNQLALAINNLGDQLESQLARLSHQAFYDHLSNLPNRALFEDRLDHALRSSSRKRSMVAVMFLDLDNFKIVNDSLGHRVGDQLLVAVSERLRACLREGDTIARLGGDEFTILMEDVSDRESATNAAERILERMRAPFTIDGRELYVTVSIGVVLSDPGKSTVDELLRDADLAMYRAKTIGKACFEVFDHSLNTLAMERLELEAEMRQALDRGEFRIHYQPIVSLNSDQITGVEALLRWEHPKRGVLFPGDFVPLAEETGLIVPIGKWVLEESCRQARLWQHRFASARPLTVSVNLSAKQFQQPGLAEEIGRILRENGIAPGRLKLEITESILMEASELTRSVLLRLKALGVQLAIDDFGTGYSSLAYLKHFPIDELKIDRSFVSAMGLDPEDTAIVRTIVNLAKALDLVVTGEGIETREQLDQLLAVQCDEGQGYYFARPLPGDEMTALLDTHLRDAFPTPNQHPLAAG